MLVNQDIADVSDPYIIAPFMTPKNPIIPGQEVWDPENYPDFMEIGKRFVLHRNRAAAIAEYQRVKVLHDTGCVPAYAVEEAMDAWTQLDYACMAADEGQKSFGSCKVVPAREATRHGL